MLEKLLMSLTQLQAHLRVALPAPRPQFVTVLPTDGDAPRRVRWRDVVLVEDWTGNVQEPSYVLYIAGVPEPLRVKTPESFAAIQDRLKD